jgi:hypothetical protein
MKVRKTKLTKLTPLAEGGFGKVYRVDGFTLPGDKAPLAYKEFTADHDAQGRSAQAAVAFRAGLGPTDQAELDFYCAWPRAVVTDGRGKVCGLLMPLIPGDYFCKLADADGKMTDKPREMGWLIAGTVQRQAARIDLGEVDNTRRLLLLAQLVYAIGRLHRHGWVFGDLSFKNAVFTPDPPRVMLLDCDGAADLLDLGRKQSSTPYWDPPECPINPPPGQPRRQDLQDAVTDTYKLGLAILRCLTPGKGSSTARSSDRLDRELDPAGTRLVARALSADRTARPTAKELYAYLYGVAAPRTADPEIRMARLARPVVLSGLDARIEWQISNADRITVSAGANFSAQVDPAAYPRGFTFRARESGPVRIEAGNRFGAVTADLGELTVYELPPFTVTCDYLPTPQVPTLRAFSLEPVTNVLASRPDPGGHLPEIPPVPSLSSYGLVEGLRPGWPAVTWSGIGEAITEATADIKTQVLNHTHRHLAARQGDGT